MRNKKIAAYFCAGLLLSMAVGCGNSHGDSDVPAAGTADFNHETDTDPEEISSGGQSNKENDSHQQADTQPQPDSSPFQEDNPPLQSDSELDGIIESIGDSSVVINKTFYPSESEAVTYIGSTGVLVTVYFSEKTEFEVWTVKNSGVNGDADVEKRQGAFSDLKKGTDINMTGSYDGDDFYAEYVIIYNFV